MNGLVESVRKHKSQVRITLPPQLTHFTVRRDDQLRKQQCSSWQLPDHSSLFFPYSYTLIGQSVIKFIIIAILLHVGTIRSQKPTYNIQKRHLLCFLTSHILLTILTLEGFFGTSLHIYNLQQILFSNLVRVREKEWLVFNTSYLVSLTLKLPLVTNTEFLLTSSIQYQVAK